jgi:transcription antitermination protein NusB
VTTRRKARRLAIDILYQADLTGTPVERVVADWREAGREVPAFAEELIDGVEERQPEIDLLLEEHSEGWTVARMAALDRTILRLGVYELRYRADVPPSVAISEAVEAASELSSEGSKAYVNGILGVIARQKGGAGDVPG